MSLSIARLVDAGHFPVAEAALVKEMATRFEQETLALVGERAVSSRSKAQMLAAAGAPQ